MGRPKALLPYAGSTFLATILERLEEAGIPARVVTSPGLPIPGALVNPDPDRGQLSSLRIALEPDAAWVMMVLVDHPAVTADTYRALKQAAQEGGAALWAPVYRGRRGHPVVFGGCCLEDLMQGPLEEGARWVVQRHRHRRREVEVDDPGILRDVDTPEEYRELLSPPSADTCPSPPA